MAGIQETGSSPQPRALFGKGASRRRVGIQIDMTPMVDIAFLLLIFFMVTTVFRQPRAIELNVPEPSAKVELSTTASVLANVASDPSFDAKKVERLSQAIRDGSFRIDADAIADKLIANARELLNRGSD